METPKSIYEVYDLVERIARSIPNVNTFVETFESLNQEDTEYSAVIFQFRDGTQPSDGFVRYRFYLGYADRINDQGSDKIKIQSVAEQSLRAIINKVNADFEMEYGTFTPFEQRFTALTTGGYVECSCTLAVADCNFESNAVLRNGKVIIDANGTTTVIPPAGVDGFRQVEITADIHPTEKYETTITENGVTTFEGEYNGGDIIVNVSSVIYDEPGMKYANSTNYKFPEGLKFSARSGTDCREMFESCANLTEAPLFDTSKATNMNKMFYCCAGLAEVPTYDTGNVTNMANMFEYCSIISSIPLFNTSKVTSMSHMFGYCPALDRVPLFNTSRVTDMSYMFSYAFISKIPQFDTSKVTKMDGMFCFCMNLGEVPLLDASNVKSTTYMFDYCMNLSTLGGFKNLKVGLDLSTCTSLTHDSLMNVINNLATATATLTLGTSNLAKLTDDEKSIATAKGWTLK